MKALIADDHSLFRTGVRLLLGQLYDQPDIIEASSFTEAIDHLSGFTGPPDLMVFDLNMPGVEGIETIAALRDSFPDSKIAILSASEARSNIGEALAAGIHGYIPKSLAATEVAAAIDQILKGGIFVPLSISRRDQGVGRGAAVAKSDLDLGHFTDRQRHVINELVHNKSSKEIARALDISESTVKVHLAAIYRQLDVKTRGEAVAKVKARRLQGAGLSA